MAAGSAVAPRPPLWTALGIELPAGRYVFEVTWQTAMEGRTFTIER